MQKLLIKGKKELTGKISISGSKNATLPILAASILAKHVKIKNIPLVKDIFTMIELLNFIGLKTKLFKKQNTICAGVIFEGSVTLGKNNFIGLNVTIKNKIKIGNNNLIGAGSNVVKNIRNEKIIYGNPAK